MMGFIQQYSSPYTKEIKGIKEFGHPISSPRVYRGTLEVVDIAPPPFCHENQIEASQI